MTIFHIMYHLARADSLERARRSSFLIVLILTIFVGYSFLPPRSSNFVTLSFGNHRGIYNSAWVGSTVALLSSLSLSLIGFYLICNAVEKDRITRVGQILATTPLSKTLYTIGKTVSNFLVLAAIIVCAAITTGVMQVMLGEDTHIDLWALLSPFLFITLPTMAVISALAVFFETIPWPHNSIMNVVYFFLWLIVFNTLLPGQGVIRFVQQNDVWGATLPLSMMETATMDAFPNYKGGTALAASPLNDTFTWNGIQWTWDLIQMRLLWVFVALSVSLFAAIWFSRFDPAREWPRQSNKRSILATREETVTPATTRASLTPLTRTSSGPHFGFLLLSELCLILKGKQWWWYFIAGSLSVLSLFISLETVKALLLPIAWLWPLFVWSELGNREIRHQTTEMIFSSAPPLRYLSVQWLSGVLIALLTASGMALRFLSAGEWLNFATLIISACFIPALALALGVWTSGSRSFEVAYLTMWYLGPINHLPQLDYVGTMSSALVLQKPHYYLLATIVMLGLALIGRKRELRV